MVFHPGLALAVSSSLSTYCEPLLHLLTKYVLTSLILRATL